MKNKTKILIAFGMISALVIGFMIGVVVNYPKIDSTSASGTIGKISNYRNIKVSDANLKIHNDLVSDTLKLKQLKNYYNFHYLTAIKLSTNIGNAIIEANAVNAFKEKNQTSIDNLAAYKEFLTSARTDLLLEVSAINSVKATDPGLFMILTNQANNVVMQMNYKNKSIIGFIDDITTFVNENPSVDCASLKRIHDILSLNQVFNSAITGDKVMLKYFNKKPLLGNKEDLQIFFDQTQLNSDIQQDFERLSIIPVTDREGLALLSRLTSQETLNKHELDMATLNAGYTDLEKLGLADSEKLGIIYTDSGKLGIYFDDSEKMGSRYGDSENLGLFKDTENISMIIII